MSAVKRLNVGSGVAHTDDSTNWRVRECLAGLVLYLGESFGTKPSARKELLSGTFARIHMAVFVHLTPCVSGRLQACEAVLAAGPLTQELGWLSRKP